MSISIEEIGNLEPVTAKDDERLVKEGKREYNKQHKKENRGYCKRWNQKNPKYYEEHKEEREEYDREHRGKQLILGMFGEEGFIITLFQKVKNNSKIIGIGRFRGIKSPEQNRYNSLKHSLKGATVLNEHFEGCELHHMAKDIVIFIPKELHQSVRHNLKTGKNMEEINGKALVWFGRQTNG